MKITLEAKELMAPSDVAAMLGVTKMTVWRWVQEGKLTACHIGKYSYLIRSQVEALRDKRAK